MVATGTASGKTECFLYPILFELYRQHLAGELGQTGVRAMILYPMNALANDQRERLGEILRKALSITPGRVFVRPLDNTPARHRTEQKRHGGATRRLESKNDSPGS